MQDDYDPPECEICGSMLDRVSCWHCGGEGGFHDCGEDCCVCLDKESIDVDCEECHGEGEYWECVAIPHTEEQMIKWRKRQERREAADEQSYDDLAASGGIVDAP